MSNPTQPDVLNRMIARLEEANARSYKEPSRADEASPSSDHDDRHPSPSEPAASKRGSSWASPWFVTVVLLLVAAPVYLTSSVWESSYLDAVKLTFARWANAAVLRTDPELVTPDGDVLAPRIPYEVEQRLQRVADELANLNLCVAQIKTSQDQIGGRGAETAAQLKIDREQMMRDNANIVDQLKATQEQLKATQAQLAEVVSSGPANLHRKFYRRKRVSALSQRVSARSSVR